MLHIKLIRGDLAKCSADVLVTSANDALIGNRQPLYWRFTSRRNVDGAVREAGGKDLEDACLQFPCIEPARDGPRRDIMRWEQAAKRGESSTLRCRPGEVVSTKSFGSLDSDHVVHAVAPDSEFMYVGDFQGMPQANQTKSTVPIDLLEATYKRSYRQATEIHSAKTIAVPSLGTGVKGWRPMVSSSLALKALVAHFFEIAEDERRVTFVLGDDASWIAWTRSFRHFLGQSPNDEWHLSPTDQFHIDLTTLPGTKPKSRGKSGWAGEYWNPTDNGW